MTKDPPHQSTGLRAKTLPQLKQSLQELGILVNKTEQCNSQIFPPMSSVCGYIKRDNEQDILSTYIADNRYTHKHKDTVSKSELERP